MKVSVFIATSLDGYIARKDGAIDWLTGIENPPNEDYGYAEFINGIDVIVMGRGTFEKALTFPSWPYDKKVFVLSGTMTGIPRADLGDKVSLLSMKPNEILEYLSRQDYSSVYLDGGKTIQSFLREDLVDELIITRIPILLGDGIPLFGELEGDLTFEHLGTKTYSNGLVKTRYRRKRD